MGWNFERSSGYAGYRSDETGEWLSLREYGFICDVVNPKKEIAHIHVVKSPMKFIEAVSVYLNQIGRDPIHFSPIEIHNKTVSFELTEKNRDCLDFINKLALGWNMAVLCLK
jgi:hypothetical protein